MNETKIKQFVPLTNDLLFKETFKQPKFLGYLLEIYYNYERGHLKGKLKIETEAELDKTSFKDKNFRTDLKVTIDNEIICDIEMYQTFNEEAFNKSLMYVMRINSTQLKVGSNYSDIKKVTQINFVDNVKGDIEFTIGEELKKKLYFINEGIGKNINMDVVRLDKARELDYTLNNEFINLLKFIGAKSQKERDEYAKRDDRFMEINEWVNNHMTDDEWWRTYNDYYWNARINYKDGVDDGRVAGIEENKLEVAKNMLRHNDTIAYIKEITGLSTKKIKDLKKSIEK